MIQTNPHGRMVNTRTDEPTPHPVSLEGPEPPQFDLWGLPTWFLSILIGSLLALIVTIPFFVGALRSSGYLDWLF